MSALLTAVRATLRCPTCGFRLDGMPWHQALQVDRCLACGLGLPDVEPVPSDTPRKARWGEFPI